jgi:Malectin domain/Chitobiase/beta-hexosaminidase C-terminal domain/Legume lectin domain
LPRQQAAAITSINGSFPPPKRQPTPTLKTRQRVAFLSLPFILFIYSLLLPGALAQTSVLTQHNDISRTGANTNETILTPANVNTNSFGKLFTYVVDGYVYAQPLYMPGVTMGSGTAQAGTTHNVLFIATEHDSVYALDADANLGTNANPLWQVSLLDNAHGVPSGVTATTVPDTDVSTDDILPEIGVTGTGVIDPTTGTLYVVGKTKENGLYFQRLHALDISTGAEKFGGPVTLAASVRGNGNGSSGGILNWDPKWENQRAALLLLNGIVYIAFASHGDNGPWHGWVLGYNASTLTQTGVWCSTPNGTSAGIWMGGAGLAASVPDPVNHPYGQLFIATGNGTFDAAPPYANSMDYGDSILKLDLTNGAPTMSSGGTTVGDDFTPHDQTTLNNGDEDLGSGGVLLLPNAVAGANPILTQIGKPGRVYLLNRNSLGGYNANNTIDPGEAAYAGGVWGMLAYWNGNVYVWGTSDNLKAFSINSGTLSSAPTSISNESAGRYSPTPSISANGNTNGIVWNLRTDNYSSNGREVLYAHDATNVANLLYSSESNVSRDNPGNSVKFIVPTVVNGKVYVGAEYQVSAFGLLNGAIQAAAPVLSPATQTFASSLNVTMADSSPGVQIYYTTDGSTPSTASTVYTGPFTVTTTETIQAIAAGPGILQSTASTATYTLQTQVSEPTFTPPPGQYSVAQSISISSATTGATIYYTTDGSTPTTTSTRYTGPVSFSSSTTLQALATAPNLSNSLIASGDYAIDSNALGFGNGFTPGGMIFNGKTTLNGTRLRLTDGGGSEASSAWFPTPVDIQSFATDFTFQITGTSPTADGFTFTIQGNSTSVLGVSGGGLGYGPDTPGETPGIANSVAVKFDLYSNNGEGTNSTGLYTNGASPSIPATTLGGGVNLHSSDIFHVHFSYDGTTLTMTITDTANSADSFTTSWPINIPATVGGDTAYLGFTAGTGGLTAIQDILTWTYAAGNNGTPTTATPAFSLPGGTYSGPQTVSLSDATPGATIFFTLDGSTPATVAGGSTQQYASPITVNSTETINAIATASGDSASSVASSTYTIESQVAAPVFAPAAGTYASPQQVTITCATSGAAIYYTTNGATPTTSSTVYTAPITVNATETIKAIAAESGFLNSSVSTATYTIATGVFSAILVHSGDGAYTDTSGQLWSADQGFNGGKTYTTTQSVQGTADPVLYESERYGPFAYNFTVPNGNYTVVLKFAEIYYTRPGSRIFNVSINGTPVLTNFDIVATAGAAFTALDESFPVSVTNGMISIQFITGTADLPKISAVEIAQTGVAVRLSPSTATLSASQTQQFTATVTGTTNTGVTWALNPAIGTLSNSGLYTAPSSITTTQTVSVTATSMADATRSASATVHLQSSQPAVVAVHSGDGAYTDTSGQLWSADQGFNGGKTYTTTQSVQGTADPVLYESERYGPFAYNFTVPNGNCTVVLKFAEIYYTRPGSRIFNVSINGTPVLTNFDIVATAGAAFTALDESFPVSVTNGMISIQFITGTADLPKISAVEIR